MKDTTMMPSPVLRLAAAAAALLGLAACVYVPVGAPVGSPPGYAYAPGYDAGAPQEQGYYYAPDYGYPPVVGSVNLGFGYWGGGRRDR